MVSDAVRDRLQQLGPTFTAAQARGAGIAPRELYRMRDDELVDELSRGVFRKTDAPATAHLDLIAVSVRAPAAILCLDTSLALHDLIDDIPATVHIAVPRSAHRPAIQYPAVTVSRFELSTFELGLEHFEAAPGEMVRVYSASRSVVDAMRLRRKFGESLALHALGRYLRRSKKDVTELLRLARLLDVEGPMRTATEAVLA